MFKKIFNKISCVLTVFCAARAASALVRVGEREKAIAIFNNLVEKNTKKM